MSSQVDREAAKACSLQHAHLSGLAIAAFAVEEEHGSFGLHLCLENPSGDRYAVLGQKAHALQVKTLGGADLLGIGTYEDGREEVARS